MPPIIREATLEDAELLVQVIDMASDGLIPAFWEEMAPEGGSGRDVGLSQVTAEDDEFSYRNGLIAELNDEPLGGMIGHPLPTTPEDAGPEVPEAFVPIKELTNLALGYWYINVLAALPESRGQGLGGALLDAAEARARSLGCPGLALIVAVSNTGAIRLYERAGYRAKARRPFDLADFGGETDEVVLMVKELD